ncbi:MAG: hypothetical protein H6735_22925 [Alphaproteobacteria bacterium]|nr:hypothetical protein [Alphaproteobacteria bacterium]
MLLVVSALSVVAAAPAPSCPDGRTVVGGCGCAPVDHLVAVGYGHGPEDQARRLARDDARQRLLGQVCAGVSGVRCDAVGRRVSDWTQGDWASRKRGVCALAAVPRSFVTTLEQDAQAAHTAAAEAVAQLARRGVDRVEASWEGGVCGPAEVGPLLVAELQNGLAAGEGAAGERAKVSLVHGADRVRVSVRVGGSLVAGWDVPYDVLGVTGDPEPCTAAGRVRPVPVAGSVGGREEVHWVNGCADLQGAPGDTGWRSLTRLCLDYEAFRISQEDYARRSAELMDASGKPAGVALQVRAVRSDGRPLRTGDAVSSGDRFTVWARPAAEAWVMVVYENSAGESEVWPASGGGLHVAAGEERRLPEPGFTFEMADPAGQAEVIHVLASPWPLGQGESAVSLIDRYRTKAVRVVADDAPAVLSVTARGVDWFGDLSEQVTGVGGAVHTLVLDHR